MAARKRISDPIHRPSQRRRLPVVHRRSTNESTKFLGRNMKISATFTIKSMHCLTLGLTLLLGFAAGCGSKGGSSESQQSAQEEAPKTVQSAFKEARPEIKAEADQIVAAMQNQEAPKAFLQLQQLSSRTDLTAEQSVAAARATASVRAQLQAAAARGDKAAVDVLEAYHNSK